MRGTSTGGDVVKTLVTGEDVNDVWREFAATLDARNNDRENLLSFLTYKTQVVGDTIAQTTDVDDFEEASEFGVPKGLRAPGTFLTLGFNFKWFDAATRFTWKFLMDADRAQVEAVHNAVLESDNRLVFRSCMGALLNPANRTNPEGLTVFGLYNADGTVPPEHAGQTFLGTHDHYLVSGAATLDGNDIIDATRHVQHHGHGDVSRGSRVVVFVNPAEAEVARSITRGATSAVDFIPSVNAPAFLTDQTIVGDRAPAALGRIPLFGSLGSAWLSENALIPAGYIVAVAVAVYGGGGSDQRAVLAIREHVRADARGLRQIPGGNGTYPLQDSYYSRGFGTGIRQRGGAAVMQIKATGTYDVPAAYSTVLA